MTLRACWAGVDVGGRKKGFHGALLYADNSVQLARFKGPAQVVTWLQTAKPVLTAIDSPRSLAAPGKRSRDGERALVAAGICHIRYTPDDAGLKANPSYHDWITNGCELYAACANVGLNTIECFPTASWSRWAGPRGQRRRTEWTKTELGKRALDGLPQRTSQDDRDAIAAALTAKAHIDRKTDCYGEIIVPKP